MVQHLVRYRAAAGQRCAPGQVVTGLVEVGLTRPDRRGQGVAVGEQGAHLSHGLRQVRLGLVQRELGVRAVESYQRLTGLYDVGILGVYRQYRTGGLRHDLHHVTGHIGIVGVLDEATGEGPPASVPGTRDSEQQAEQQHQPPSPALVVRGS